MRYRPLGRTGIEVSQIAFGAGPVSGLMTGNTIDDQVQTVLRATELGINWFDTAATYGKGTSEESLGKVLQTIHANHPIHVATKVRLILNGQETDLRPLVVESVRQSLSRLRIPRITLLQLHNSITPNRNDEPTSITPDDVLGPRSVVAAMDDLRSAGLIDQFGLTGIGDPESLRTVIRSERFATIQAPFHLLNPTTLYEAPSSWPETNYRRFLEDAHELQMGIFAIRVFAAGALLDAPPSSHTLTTPFFPLDLYERDRCTARKLKQNFDASSMAELSLRYVLSHDQITASIIGFGNPSQVEQAVEFTNCGPLPNARLRQLNEFVLNSNCE